MAGTEIVVVGTSLGGLHALEVILSGLTRDFALPMVVVQHRDRHADGMLNAVLQRYSVLPVREPEDKEIILPGWVYLAPADYHLLVERGRFSLSTEGRVCHARPSIDVLFESAASAYGARSVGVILTGASRDGAWGAGRIKGRGGLIVVEDPETAESRTLPDAAQAACGADHVLPLSQIAPFLAGLGPWAPG